MFQFTNTNHLARLLSDLHVQAFEDGFLPMISIQVIQTRPEGCAVQASQRVGWTKQAGLDSQFSRHGLQRLFRCRSGEVILGANASRNFFQGALGFGGEFLGVAAGSSFTSSLK